MYFKLGHILIYKTYHSAETCICNEGLGLDRYTVVKVSLWSWYIVYVNVFILMTAACFSSRSGIG
jgi:hypothetical protein